LGWWGLVGDDVEVVDDRDSAQIEQVLALAEVAGTASLPAADVGQGVLNLDPLAQLGPPVWGLLRGAQLGQQPLVGVDLLTSSTCRAAARSAPEAVSDQST
jgi:hypothetical protein